MPRVSAAIRPRIAIAGATGRVGGALVARLVHDPADVVALTRTPGTQHLPPDIAIAQIDFAAPLSLDAALQDVDRLFLAHGTSADQVANEVALIDAAVASGVKHIVKLSVMGPASALHPFDWHMAIEAHLAGCDIGYTLLRPSAFMDILMRAGAPVASDTWGGAAGEGRVNLIDSRDVADVARIALLDTEHLGTQRAYHLTGPAATSMPDIADDLSRLLGRTVAYRHRSPAEHRAILMALGVSELVADVLLGIDRLFHGSVLAETTCTVADLTGTAPRSTSAWLGENVRIFQ